MDRNDVLTRAGHGWIRNGLALAVAWGVGSAPLAGRAAPLPFADRIISYQVVEQDLPAVLEGLARQVGVHADVSGKVEGKVHGRLAPDTLTGLLDKLAAIYGLEWYFDGRALYVSAASETVAKVVPIRKVGAAELQDTLARLGTTDPRWPIRTSRRGDLAELAGPPHYVALIEQTLAAMPDASPETVAEVHIFRGSTAGAP